MRVTATAKTSRQALGLDDAEIQPAREVRGAPGVMRTRRMGIFWVDFMVLWMEIR